MLTSAYYLLMLHCPQNPEVNGDDAKCITQLCHCHSLLGLEAKHMPHNSSKRIRVGRGAFPRVLSLLPLFGNLHSSLAASQQGSSRCPWVPWLAIWELLAYRLKFAVQPRCSLAFFSEAKSKASLKANFRALMRWDCFDKSKLWPSLRPIGPEVTCHQPNSNDTRLACSSGMYGWQANVKH